MTKMHPFRRLVGKYQSWTVLLLLCLLLLGTTSGLPPLDPPMASFSHEQLDGLHHLTYDWQPHARNRLYDDPVRAEFAVPDTALRNSKIEYGFRYAERDSILISAITTEAHRRGLSHVIIRFHADSLVTGGTRSESEGDLLDRIVDSVSAPYHSHHGIMYKTRQDTLSIDYGMEFRRKAPQQNLWVEGGRLSPVCEMEETEL